MLLLPPRRLLLVLLLPPRRPLLLLLLLVRDPPPTSVPSPILLLVLYRCSSCWHRACQALRRSAWRCNKSDSAAPASAVRACAVDLYVCVLQGSPAPWYLACTAECCGCRRRTYPLARLAFHLSHMEVEWAGQITNVSSSCSRGTWNDSQYLFPTTNSRKQQKQTHHLLNNQVLIENKPKTLLVTHKYI